MDSVHAERHALITRAIERVHDHARMVDEPRPHVVVAIDPSDRGSGIAVWQVRSAGSDPAEWAKLSLGHEHVLSSTAIPLSWVGWGVAESVALLDSLIGSAEWMAAVERPPPPKVGRRSAPMVAERHWLDAITELRRVRCRRERQRYRVRATLRPRPSEWRRALGLPIAAPRWMRGSAGVAIAGSHHAAQEPARWLKDQMLARAATLGVKDLEDHNEAEAILIGLWATGRVRAGWTTTPKGRPLEIAWSI